MSAMSDPNLAGQGSAKPDQTVGDSMQVACGRCGAPRDRMRCPDDWDAETVAKWRTLEERFLCDACEALVVAYSESIGCPGVVLRKTDYPGSNAQVQS